jgi:RimJ/RimL family protein N-acetyltransferase
MRSGSPVGGISVYQWKGTKRYTLGSIFVTPPNQKKNIGALALQEAEKLFVDAKYWELVVPSHEPKILDFFKKSGYREFVGKDAINDASSVVIFKKHMPFETERLVMRPFLPEDWQGMLACDIQPFEKARKSEENAKSEALRLSSRLEHFAIIFKETGDLSGCLFLSDHLYQFGVRCSMDQGRTALTTEALEVVLDRLFDDFNAPEVFAEPGSDKQQDWMYLMSMGFSWETERHKWFSTAVKKRNYHISASDWMKNKQTRASKEQ